jgi:cholesterol transport system auxiliary component
MIYLSFDSHCRLGAAILVLSLLGGCSALRPTSTPPPALFLLDSRYSEAAEATIKSRRWRDEMPRMGYGTTAPTLIVNPPHAAAGFDSQRIIYVREPHQLEYFAHSSWVDTPARMIVPLIVVAVENSGAFRAVVLTPSAATGDLRLDTEIIRLQQDFGSRPSHVRFTLRAFLVDNTTRQVLAQREFDASVTAAGDDPRSGVQAANRAVYEVLENLADFCGESAAHWKTVTPDNPAGVVGSVIGG